MKEFDLNIENILENWEVYHAVREIIANALDEQIQTNTDDISIVQENGSWHIIDYGRGLNYHHLTQNENIEKLQNKNLIGRFGVGLKDALATLYRHNVKVRIESRYGIITLKQAAKADFSDIVTLHAQIEQPQNPKMVGTNFMLSGCTEDDIEKAKSLFLIFNPGVVMAKTPYGQIIKKESSSSAAFIYINGVKVAEEPNFLFSYNITSLTKQLQKALNRERTNVGRTAYADRIRSILLASNDEQVVQMLVEDLQSMSTGNQHDEVKWAEVASHAVKLLSKREDTVFVTPDEYANTSGGTLEVVAGSGKKIVFISENVKQKAIKEDDSVATIQSVVKDYNDNFQYNLIPFDELSINQQTNLIDLQHLLEWLGLEKWYEAIKISESLTIDDSGVATLGVWDREKQIIVIRRDQLDQRESLFAVALHEITHATSGAGDCSRYFESALTDLIGNLAEKLQVQHAINSELKLQAARVAQSSGPEKDPDDKLTEGEDNQDGQEINIVVKEELAEWVQWYHLYSLGFYSGSTPKTITFHSINSSNFTIDIDKKSVVVRIEKDLYEQLADVQYFTLGDTAVIMEENRQYMGAHPPFAGDELLLCSDGRVGAISAPNIEAPMMVDEGQYFECEIIRREQTEYSNIIEARILDLVINKNICTDDGDKIQFEKLFSMQFREVNNNKQ